MLCFIYRFYFYLFFIFGHEACEILVPQPGIEPLPPAVEVWSPNHQTTGKYQSSTFKCNPLFCLLPLFSPTGILGESPRKSHPDQITHPDQNSLSVMCVFEGSSSFSFLLTGFFFFYYQISRQSQFPSSDLISAELLTFKCIRFGEFPLENPNKRNHIYQDKWLNLSVLFILWSIIDQSDLYGCVGVHAKFCEYSKLDFNFMLNEIYSLKLYAILDC